MSLHFIEAHDLSYVYETEGDGDVVALDRVSFHVDEGEYIAVLGHNGSGKSTLAKMLNMILFPTEGEVVIDGKVISAKDDEDSISDEELFDIRRKIGMVFQNPDNQLVATMVEEDVAFAPENLGLPREEIRRRVDDALALVGMTEYARHAPHKLSGGQKQRVAIAGIIAMMPRCIIFDESTAMLDPLGRRDVIDAMERLNRERGMTVLNITHYMEEAARADRIIVISDGKILMDGKPSEVFSRVNELVACGLDVPQTTELLYELGESGYNLPRGITTVDAALEALMPLFASESEVSRE